VLRYLLLSLSGFSPRIFFLLRLEFMNEFEFFMPLRLCVIVLLLIKMHLLVHGWRTRQRIEDGMVVDVRVSHSSSIENEAARKKEAAYLCMGHRLNCAFVRKLRRNASGGRSRVRDDEVLFADWLTW
jgi:hypothetical protein